eukprot:gene21019-23072_t
MAGRSDLWKVDEKMRENLEDCNSQGIHRQDMLDYMKRDYPQYNWSFRTLCRRLNFFKIAKTDYFVTTQQVKEAVGVELKGPGRQLGYRAMHQKIRQMHGLNVPRDLVYAAMTDLDSKGLSGRAVGAKRQKKGHFVSRGPDWVHSLNGHCKLMGYQRSTFPLSVYGCLDTASRKILWLRIWTDNCDPQHVGRWYLEYLYQSRLAPSMIRIDKCD